MRQNKLHQLDMEVYEYLLHNSLSPMSVVNVKITVQSSQVIKLSLKAIKITLGINQGQCSLLSFSWSMFNDSQGKQPGTNQVK